MTKFVGPCKGRCLLVAASINSGTDDEPKTAQFDTKRGALHRTIPALVWKLLPPGRLCLFSPPLFYRLLPLPPPPPRLYLLSIDAIHRTN
ncbi:hypothetical protein A0O28_0006800 [Trichoderma guizhouense]|uniref:Uncharacterized protein n=1 Tax=Trichoderma guizhouense TaxID=1491466 RepID=A0A1T3CHP0_9HYPO|nr:hypothetical protein A0O28_0006800 [Trichoderma guizhouense]